MKHTYIYTLLIVSLVMTSSACSKGSSGGDQNLNAPDITTPVVLNPQSPVLSFPLNNEPCLDTTEVNDTQSSVDFRWNASENALSYMVVVRNLSTSTEQEFSASSNEKTIVLQSAEPYSWKVRAIGASGSSPADSSTWRFYLPGPEQVNYAPFPAELTSPISGSTVTPIDGLIDLQWTCSDADNDLARFEVYLDQADGSTLIQTIDYETATTALQVEVENNEIYHWKIIAIDALGNQSDSGVYSFRTN